MRCSDCNKFVSYDQAEPELTSFQVDSGKGEAEITGTVHVDLNCGECGTTLKSADIDIDHNITVPCIDTADDGGDSLPGGAQGAGPRSGGHEMEITEESAEPSERTEGRGRGMKTFYGAEITVEVVCSCGAKAESTWMVDEQASDFE